MISDANVLQWTRPLAAAAPRHADELGVMAVRRRRPLQLVTTAARARDVTVLAQAHVTAVDLEVFTVLDPAIVEDARSCFLGCKQNT